MKVKSDTQAVWLDTDARTAFRFIADPNSLPMWAVGFCRAIRQDKTGWIVQTATGECPLQVEADEVRGTIDFHMDPAPSVKVSAYSRVIPCAEGCVYVFTQFSSPTAPEGMFEANVEALREELVVLRSVLRARQLCPA